MRLILVLIAIAGFAAVASAQEYRIEDVPSVTALPIDKLKAGVIAFSDHRGDPLVEASTGGLMKFTEWTRGRPVQKQLLSLYPAYEEPTLKSTSGGVTKTRKARLHMYVADARFLVNKPSIDFARYVTLPFVEKLDPAISSKLIPAAEALPDRAWCESRPATLCIASRYKFEGKLPIGIVLLNQLRDSEKKVADYIDFHSELRALTPTEIDEVSLQKLTGLDTPVIGVLEQSIFYVNQIMQFGKFIAVAQKHPSASGQTVVTAFAALAVESDILEKKKEYERVPVLRNLVPAQVLSGNSSFNTGSSISSGLPNYARNRIKAIAQILSQDATAAKERAFWLRLMGCAEGETHQCRA
jgi:hypothetical protein